MPFCPVGGLEGEGGKQDNITKKYMVLLVFLLCPELISDQDVHTSSPMYPYLCLPLVLRPTSQIALMFFSWKPTSLLRIVMQFVSTTKARAGWTPSDG